MDWETMDSEHDWYPDYIEVKNDFEDFMRRLVRAYERYVEDNEMDDIRSLVEECRD